MKKTMLLLTFALVAWTTHQTLVSQYFEERTKCLSRCESINKQCRSGCASVERGGHLSCLEICRMKLLSCKAKCD
jgi:hypothetical protein